MFIPLKVLFIQCLKKHSLGKCNEIITVVNLENDYSLSTGL